MTGLNTVNQFNYLGCTILPEVKISKEIDNGLVIKQRLETIMKQKAYKERYKNQRVDNHFSAYSTLQFRLVDYLSSSWLPISWINAFSVPYLTSVGVILSVTPWSSNKQRCLRYNFYRKENYCLWKIQLYGELSPGDHNSLRYMVFSRLYYTLILCRNTWDLNLDPWLNTQIHFVFLFNCFSTSVKCNTWLFQRACLVTFLHKHDRYSEKKRGQHILTHPFLGRGCSGVRIPSHIFFFLSGPTFRN